MKKNTVEIGIHSASLGLVSKPSRISVIVIRAILSAAKAYGFDTKKLMADAGIELSDLASDDLTIDRSRELAILEAAYHESGDPNIAMRFGSFVVRGQFLGLEYLLRTSPTVGEALHSLVRFSGILRDVQLFTFDENARRMMYLPEYNIDNLGEQLVVEYVMSIVVSFGSEMTSVDWKTCDLHFRHQRQHQESKVAPPTTLKNPSGSAGASIAPNTPSEILRLPVSFGQEDSVVIFSEELVAHTMPEADPLLFRILSESAADHVLRSQQSEHIADAVSSAIVDALPDTVPSIEAISMRMSHTPQSLQAKLSEEGQQFDQLLENVRSALAKQYLQEDLRLSLLDVALLLGYENVSVFHQAFCRWTGLAPDEYRRRFGILP